MDVNDNRNLDWSDNKNESSQPSRIYFKFLMLLYKYEPVEKWSAADGETTRTAVLLQILKVRSVKNPQQFSFQMCK